jgi:hypothetical protein
MEDTVVVSNVVDFTAAKLNKLADTLENEEDAEIIYCILAEYYEGEIAIAWENGGPVIMPLSDKDRKNGIPPGFAVVGYDKDMVGKDDEGG